MKNQFLKIGGVFALVFFLAGYSALAQNKLTWDKIGTETVDYTIDHDVELPEVLNQDNDGKLIDLAGNKRLIEKVTFWYDTENKNDEKAVVEVWARK